MQTWVSPWKCLVKTQYHPPQHSLPTHSHSSSIDGFLCSSFQRKKVGAGVESGGVLVITETFLSFLLRSCHPHFVSSLEAASKCSWWSSLCMTPWAQRWGLAPHSVLGERAQRAVITVTRWLHGTYHIILFSLDGYFSPADRQIIIRAAISGWHTLPQCYALAIKIIAVQFCHSILYKWQKQVHCGNLLLMFAGESGLFQRNQACNYSLKIPKPMKHSQSVRCQEEWDRKAPGERGWHLKMIRWDGTHKCCAIYFIHVKLLKAEVIAGPVLFWSAWAYECGHMCAWLMGMPGWYKLGHWIYLLVSTHHAQRSL